MTDGQTVATTVLLHSPLVDASTWGEVPERLRALGHDVIVVDVDDDLEPPYAARYVACAAQQVQAARPSGPLVLVGHSGAGPLLPQLGFAQRAAHRRVGAYVFLDATLPRAGASRLDLLHAENEAVAHDVHHALEAGGLEPRWDARLLAADGLAESAASTVLASLRPRGLAFFDETLPHPGDWPDAPCAFVQTSAARAGAARVAALRGFAVEQTGGGHFAALARPAEVAAVLHRLAAEL